jgi:sarcosine oxidase, subunit gamma
MTNSAIQLENLGVLPQLKVKGLGAADWLREHSFAVPSNVFDTLPLSDDAWIARLGETEFLAQWASDDDILTRIGKHLLLPRKDIFSIPCSDATIQLSGAEARSVFAQTCGIDFRKTPLQRILFTRVAGVSCGIIPQANESEVSFRLMCDCSYSAYLWETLAGITTELGGITH